MDIMVFIDWQNVYRQAREAFGLDNEPTERGIISPLLAAKTLAGRNERGNTANLKAVEIHRGLPDPRAEAAANRAVLRQRDAWLAEDPALIVPRLRPLRLNKGTNKTEEKGVDVALAISALEQIIDETCELAIVFSHDSDLQPLLEAICRLKGPQAVETASWRTDNYFKQIPAGKTGVYNHPLKRAHFDKWERPVNYAYAGKKPRRSA